MGETSFSEHPENGMSQIQIELRRLERRDRWLWAAAVAVMLLLTVAVALFSLSALSAKENPFFRDHLGGALRGLLGLVLLFTIHIIYQQFLVRRLRRQLAGQLDTMARQEARVNELRHLALTDPVTGVYNRRFVEEYLETEIARAQRQGYQLTAMMVDLTNFRDIITNYGHPAGI